MRAIGREQARGTARMPWRHASVVLLLLLSGIASAAAQTEGVCGNTYVDNLGGGLMCNGIPCDEGCDDGNLDDGDGCSQFCTVEDGWSCTGEAAIAACRTVCFSMLPGSVQHARFRHSPFLPSGMSLRERVRRASACASGARPRAR